MSVNASDYTSDDEKNSTPLAPRESMSLNTTPKQETANAEEKSRGAASRFKNAIQRNVSRACHSLEAALRARPSSMQTRGPADLARTAQRLDEVTDGAEPSVNWSAQDYRPDQFSERTVAGLDDWGGPEAISPATLQAMVAILIDDRQNLFLFFYPERWVSRAKLALDEPQAFHFCLIAAIALAVCSLSSDKYNNLEESLVSKTKEHIEACLAKRDRVEDGIYAGFILIQHYLRQGQASNAFITLKGLTNLAIACNLHQQPEPRAYRQRSYAPLPAPDDVFHATERISLFWSIWFLDVSWRRPDSPFVSESMKVTTILPINYGEVERAESPNLFRLEDLNDSCADEPPGDLFLNGLNLALRAAHLYIRALRLGRQARRQPHLEPEFISALKHVLDEVEDLKALIPPYDEFDTWIQPLERSSRDLPLGQPTTALSNARSITVSAGVLICRSLTPIDIDFGDRAMYWALEIVDEPTDLLPEKQFKPGTVSSIWLTVLEVLVKELKAEYAERQRDDALIDRLRTASQFAVRNLEYCANFHPGLRVYTEYAKGVILKDI